MSYFDVLGVSRTANDHEIRSAYERMLAQLEMDDVSLEERAEQRAIIEEAWETLESPLRRALYASTLDESATDERGPAPETSSVPQAGRATPQSPAEHLRPPTPGKPVFLKGGFWVVVAVIAGIGALADANEDSKNDSPSYTPTNVNASTATWRIGNCINGYSTVYPVYCTQLHSGKIVSTASNQYACPTYTESYVLDTGFVWCIDEDL